MELERMFSLKPLLKELEDGHLPFVCLQYNDADGVQHLVAAVYLGNVDALSASKLKNVVCIIMLKQKRFWSLYHCSIENTFSSLFRFTTLICLL